MITITGRLAVLVAVLFLAACAEAKPKPVSGEICQPNDPQWALCMENRKRGRHPPAQLLFTDWR